MSHLQEEYFENSLLTWDNFLTMPIIGNIHFLFIPATSLKIYRFCFYKNATLRIFYCIWVYCICVFVYSVFILNRCCLSTNSNRCLPSHLASMTWVWSQGALQLKNNISTVEPHHTRRRKRDAFWIQKL